MKRISSILTIPYKIILLVISIILFLFGIILFSNVDILAVVIILIVSIMLFVLSKRLKSIYIDNGFVVSRGFFSKQRHKTNEVKRVGNIFLFFYLEMNTKKRIFFLNTIKDEVKALIDSSESVEKDIFKKINL